jgi:hypothetical protein
MVEKSWQLFTGHSWMLSNDPQLRVRAAHGSRRRVHAERTAGGGDPQYGVTGSRQTAACLGNVRYTISSASNREVRQCAETCHLRDMSIAPKPERLL